MSSPFCSAKTRLKAASDSVTEAGLTPGKATSRIARRARPARARTAAGAAGSRPGEDDDAQKTTRETIVAVELRAEDRAARGVSRSAGWPAANKARKTTLPSTGRARIERLAADADRAAAAPGPAGEHQVAQRPERAQHAVQDQALRPAPAVVERARCAAAARPWSASSRRAASGEQAGIGGQRPGSKQRRCHRGEAAARRRRMSGRVSTVRMSSASANRARVEPARWR